MYFSGCLHSITIEYDCSRCVEGHIKKLLSEKGLKWQQIGEDKYISKRWIIKEIDNFGTQYGIPKMLISRSPNQAVCTRVSLSIEMMKKTDWKQQLKTTK